MLLKHKADFGKNKFTLTCLLAGLMILLPGFSKSQSGNWTWMHGDNTLNGTVVYGIQGIPGPGVKPPGLLYPAKWRDLAGNFWLYGGDLSAGRHGDLWRFNPITNQWTWIHGPGTADQPPQYGTQGAASPTNYPGARGNVAATWVDAAGNLWFFGGFGFDENGNLGAMNDLWKYEPGNNTWTWVNGSNHINSPGNYGVMQVADPGNQPSARYEPSACWTAADGSLWMFGGGNGNAFYNDLWKFDPQTMQWTWIHGAPGMQVNPVYGTQGTAAGTNTPGSRKCYSSWTDNCGNLWLFGGRLGGNAGDANDLWCYSIPTNMWTWKGGPSNQNAGGIAGLNCQANSGFVPSSRWANTASCIDPRGRFWQFGGRDFSTPATWNDLWVFNPGNAQFSCVKGVPSSVAPSSYGSLLTPSASNMPPQRYAGAAWSDLAGNIWVFGGSGSRNDLWRFTPTPGCPSGWTTSANAQFNADVRAGCAPMQVQFFNQSTNANRYTWYFGDGSTSTVSGPSHTFTEPGTYLVTLLATDSTNCSQLASIDTIMIQVLASLELDLGPDTAFCDTEPITLNAGPAGFTYSWNTGATSPTLIPGNSGIYAVTVSGGSCFLHDSITIAMDATPLVNLGPDTMVCGNVPLPLNASPGGVNNSYSFLWSTTESTTHILAPNPGDYSVEVTNGSCTRRDTVNVGFYYRPGLVTDTTACEGIPLTLTAEPAFGHFQWSTDDTTSSITVVNSGTYTLTVSNPGCVHTATINVNVEPLPVVNLGPDTTLCELVSFALDAGNAGNQFAWNTHESTQDISVTSSGTYSVTVSGPHCSASDSVQIFYAGPPDLGPDTVSCPATPVLLDAGDADSWLWNTGQTTGMILANSSGVYSVTTQIANCTFTDTVQLFFKALPFVHLGPDTTGCPGEVIYLDASAGGVNAGSDFEWNTGGTTSFLKVRTPGVYSVTVTFDGCTSVDTLNVSFETHPDLGTLRSLCEEDPLILNAGNTPGDVLWSTGHTGPSITIEEPGMYWVAVQTEHCLLTDTAEVVGDGGRGTIFTPNVFTPNEDGINDVFKIKGAIFTRFDLTVYSRWGQVVYHSTDANSGWNGEFNQDDVPADNYIYQLNYSTPCTGAKVLQHSGNVQLLR